MMDLKQNKLITFFFIIGILQIFYYWNNRSNFKFEVLKNPFKKNSHINYVMPKPIIETNKLLTSNNIKNFNLSEKLKNDMYTFQRIIEYNYPIRLDEKAKYILVYLDESFSCQTISKGEFIELQKCQ